MFHTPAHKQASRAKAPGQALNKIDQIALDLSDAVTFTPTQPLDLAGRIIDFENGDLNEDEVIELFQGLIDTGLAWQLQGCYGRAAHNLIAQGLCTA